MMFAIPNKIPKKNRVHDNGKADALLDWPLVHKKYPWSIIFLMGGGFALAEACEVNHFRYFTSLRSGYTGSDED